MLKEFFRSSAIAMPQLIRMVTVWVVSDMGMDMDMLQPIMVAITKNSIKWNQLTSFK